MLTSQFIVLAVLGLVLCLETPRLLPLVSGNALFIKLERAARGGELSPEALFQCDGEGVTFSPLPPVDGLIVLSPWGATPSLRAEMLLDYLSGDVFRAAADSARQARLLAREQLADYLYGLLLARRGEWDRALAVWGDAGLQKALHQMGLRFEGKVPPNRHCAIAYYDLALLIDPAYQPALVSLAYSRWNEGDVASAAAAFEQASDLATSEFERYLYAGHARHLEEHYKEATQAYSKALSYSQTDRQLVARYLGHAYLGLGRTYYRQGAFQAAIDSLQEGIRLAGQSALAEMYLADVYSAIADCERALDASSRGNPFDNSDTRLPVRLNSGTTECNGIRPGR